MSIEYRGENKFRFRVRKDGIYHYQNYYSNKDPSEDEIKKKNWAKEIQDAHKKFEVDVMRGSIGCNENMLFSKLAQMVMDEHVRPNLKPNTQNNYLNAYNTHLLECFGGMKLSKIKKIHVQRFINEKNKELKPSSIENLYTILRATFSKAVEWEIIKENPCSKISLPKIENKNYNELLSANEISKLMEAINNEPEMYKVISSIALYCGLRQGEILGLTIADIDLENNYINVNKQYVSYYKNKKLCHEIASTKTDNSIRKVYMPAAVSTILDKYINNMKILNINQDKQYLFINPETQAIYDRNALYRRFKIMAKLIGLNNITFHDLRHLQATMMINSGANIVVVAKRLGDTIETVSDTYLHAIEKVEKESVSQLETFIGSIKAAE